MVTYQLDILNESLRRIGQDGEVVTTLRTKGFFVRDLHGEFGSESFVLKLPAPWRGMRYRLEQGGRELASAARAEYHRGGLTVDVEIPGRKLELASVDKYGHGFVLTESGEERARFEHRKSGQQNDWYADYHAQEESVPLAAFIVWVILENRGGLS